MLGLGRMRTIDLVVISAKDEDWVWKIHHEHKSLGEWYTYKPKMGVRDR